MPQKDMHLIDPPAAGAKVLAPESGPAMVGEGNLTYRCGGCKSRLLNNVGHDQVCGAFDAVKCPKCGRYNELPPEDQHHHHHH